MMNTFPPEENNAPLDGRKYKAKEVGYVIVKLRWRGSNEEASDGSGGAATRRGIMRSWPWPKIEWQWQLAGFEVIVLFR